MKHAPYRVAPERGSPREVHVVSWAERCLLLLLGAAAVVASVFCGLGVVIGVLGWLLRSVDLPVAVIVSLVCGSPLLLSIPVASQSFRAALRSFGYRLESHDEGLAIWEKGRERAFLRFCDIARIERAQGGGVVGVADRFGVSYRLEGMSNAQFLEVARSVYRRSQDVVEMVARGGSISLCLGKQTRFELSNERVSWSASFYPGGVVLRKAGDLVWTELHNVRLDERVLELYVDQGEPVRFESDLTEEWWQGAVAIRELWHNRAPRPVSPSLSPITQLVR